MKDKLLNLISTEIQSNLEYGLGDDEIKFDIDKVEENMMTPGDICIYATKHSTTDEMRKNKKCGCQQYFIQIKKVS